MRIALSGLAIAASTVFLSLPARIAHADGSTAGSQSRAQAAAAFAEAERAFDHGDFLHAGEAFEAAYRAAPHPDALWNAARSWERAGRPARAATVYAWYLREAPPGAPDRNTAQRHLEQLAQKLSTVEIHCSAEHALLTLDGDAIDQHVVYVSPGSHLVGAVIDGKRQVQDIDVKQGQTIAVAFDAAGGDSPPPTPSVSATPVPPAPAAPSAPQPASMTAVSSHLETPAPQARSGRWSPWVFVAEATVTLAAVGVTVWSGLQTLDTLHAFDAHATHANLSTGQSEQLRTNILLGTSVALGLLTAATAIWLVDWRGSTTTTQVGVGPGSAWWVWRF